VIRLARRNLFEDLPRLFASLGGIVFAVTLIMVQAAIYNGFLRSTSLLIEQSKADLWVASQEITFLELTLPVPADWAVVARRVPGVVQAEPLVLRAAVLRSADGRLDSCRLVGFNPGAGLFTFGSHVRGDLGAIAQPFSFAADESQLEPLHMSEIGETASIRGFPAKLVALSPVAQPLTSPTFVYTSLENAALWSPLSLDELQRETAGKPVFGAQSPISYVLVRVDPRADRDIIVRSIERLLPGSRVLTAAEMMSATRDYWIRRTNIGFLLGLGALLGLAVGAIVVGQILYASITEHLREYGTLKALGIPNRILYGSLIWQGAFMALIGFLPGLALAWAITEIAEATRRLEIPITPEAAITVFVLSVIMCVGAALFAVQRAVRADPAVVFRS
jgi:putative ABC transport system permease protein